MLIGEPIFMKTAAGERKETKIGRDKPAFLYFRVTEEYRFNCVTECLEKKVNGEWIECFDWRGIGFDGTEIVNPIWTESRCQLIDKLRFLQNERVLNVLLSLVDILMSEEEYTAYINDAVNKLKF